MNSAMGSVLRSCLQLRTSVACGRIAAIRQQFMIVVERS